METERNNRGETVNVETPQFYETPFGARPGLAPPSGWRIAKLPAQQVWSGPNPDQPTQTVRMLMAADEEISFEALSFDGLGQPAWHAILVSDRLVQHVVAQLVKHIGQTRQAEDWKKLFELAKAERSTLMEKISNAEKERDSAMQLRTADREIVERQKLMIEAQRLECSDLRHLNGKLHEKLARRPSTAKRRR